MDASFVQLMQVRQYRLRILRPKYNDLATCKGYIHLLPIERIVPDTIAFCQAVEEPLCVKGRYIGGAASGDDDGGDGLNILLFICMDICFSFHIYILKGIAITKILHITHYFPSFTFFTNSSNAAFLISN